jgi:hypothetical protein
MVRLVEATGDLLGRRIIDPMTRRIVSFAALY